ncbi:hypothetical protein BOTBODRAFT_33347 [Botryobasidium botryosum FD-172 SS1]|uniref:Uncharacterized protein n=1 Tax=Botryobasidium botryosum (strain FD-172 SS1) TaxID=930990 RepID=A0A067MDJ6_BOTB1|nr:hypothetical protein BOTBODRAFT_33347 [Botryobasidium botryosum FD-172 SS1]
MVSSCTSTRLLPSPTLDHRPTAQCPSLGHYHHGLLCGVLLVYGLILRPGSPPADRCQGLAYNPAARIREPGYANDPQGVILKFIICTDRTLDEREICSSVLFHPLLEQ